MVRHDDLEKDVTARGYCILGSQMFLYSQNAFLEDTEEHLSLVVMALLSFLSCLISKLDRYIDMYFLFGGHACHTLIPGPPDQPPVGLVMR
eukprot:1178367-Ditylum_brightwellii.AAC.1